ncbi:hypothetical protein JKP88DRAFT_329076 [Tribonema minus]|uniref:Potassium channel tetramerisation-type BTB domain-containing protein n=1 Tax=Tribonema minus TaxID=303371 RepID=A0A835YNW7_9STRA|nr:hypothetical protein JKP88DRAFT_329076 [Tribonema minus]
MEPDISEDQAAIVECTIRAVQDIAGVLDRKHQILAQRTAELHMRIDDICLPVDSEDYAPPELLTLNVGGAALTVRRSALTHFPDSPLAWMFSGCWDHVLPRDTKHRPFLDLDVSWFKPIVGALHALSRGTEPHEVVVPVAHLAHDDRLGLRACAELLGLTEALRFEGGVAALTAPPPPPPSPLDIHFRKPCVFSSEFRPVPLGVQTIPAAAAPIAAPTKPVVHTPVTMTFSEDMAALAAPAAALARMQQWLAQEVDSIATAERALQKQNDSFALECAFMRRCGADMDSAGERLRAWLQQQLQQRSAPAQQLEHYGSTSGNDTSTDNNDDIVSIAFTDVLGHGALSTRRATFLQFPASPLAAKYAAERWRESLSAEARDDEGRIYEDHDGDCFRRLVNIMRLRALVRRGDCPSGALDACCPKPEATAPMRAMLQYLMVEWGELCSPFARRRDTPELYKA